MPNVNRKRPRLRLEPEAYRELRNRVLERDGWRCQQCGRSTNLHVHHLRSRSKLGNDTCENLITLCVDCHRAVHPSGKRQDENETDRENHIATGTTQRCATFR